MKNKIDPVLALLISFIVSLAINLFLFYHILQINNRLSQEQDSNANLQATNNNLQTRLIQVNLQLDFFRQKLTDSSNLQDQLNQANQQLELSQRELDEIDQRQYDTENIYNNVELITQLSLATVRLQSTMIDTGGNSSGVNGFIKFCHGGIIRYGKKYFVITAAHCVTVSSELAAKGVIIDEVRISLSQQIDGATYGFDDNLTYVVPIETAIIFKEIDLAVIPIMFKNLGRINPEYVKAVALTMASQPINRFDPVVSTRRYENVDQSAITPTVMMIDGIAPQPQNYCYRLFGSTIPGESGSIAVNINGEIIGIISARSIDVLNVMLVGFNSIKRRLNRL